MKEKEKNFDKKWDNTPYNVISERLKNLVELYDTTNKYPFQIRMLGFTILKVKSKEELKGRIKELMDILKVNIHGRIEFDNKVYEFPFLERGE